MKKWIALLLASAMVLSMVGCGSEPQASKEQESQTEESSEAQESSEAEESSQADSAEADQGSAGESEAGEESGADAPPASEAGSFTTAVEGKLIMATNAAFPPYEYVEGGEIAGIDAEIAAAIAGKLGLELQIDDMEFDSITEAVKSGKADMGLAGMTVTPDRQEEVDFTVSYATGVQVVIVTEDSAIASVDDLFAEGASHVVGVQRNTTGDLYTTDDIEKKGLGTIDRYSKGAEAVQALKTGKVDCVVIDNQPAQEYVKANPGLEILDTEFAVEDYAIAVKKGNSQLLSEVNKALSELIADGSVQKVVDKYITAD